MNTAQKGQSATDEKKGSPQLNRAGACRVPRSFKPPFFGSWGSYHHGQCFLHHIQVVDFTQTPHTLLDHVTHLQDCPLQRKRIEESCPVPVHRVHDDVFKLLMPFVDFPSIAVTMLLGAWPRPKM